MKVKETKNHVLIDCQTKSLDNFVDKFKEEHATFLKNNIILNISEQISISETDILLFLPYAEMHQQNNKSFVVVCKGIDIDFLPENFNVVPTLNEAVDVIEFEEMQRDLGF